MQSHLVEYEIKEDSYLGHELYGMRESSTTRLVCAEKCVLIRFPFSTFKALPDLDRMRVESKCHVERTKQALANRERMSKEQVKKRDMVSKGKTKTTVMSKVMHSQLSQSSLAPESHKAERLKHVFKSIVHHIKRQHF